MSSLYNKNKTQNTIDCVILAGGHRFYCHKVILAQRSTVLKAMISAERRSQDPNSMVEIIIAGLPFATTKSVMRFIYTDSVVKKDLNSLTFTASLRDAAKKLDLSKLIFICDQVIKSGLSIIDDKLENTIDHINFPSSKMAIDLGGALADTSFADVQIITQDKTTISAHKCILGCFTRFRLILASQEHCKPRLEYSTIELPGTHDEVLRLLIYLYTGTLVCGTSHKNIIQDLINANRYNLLEMQAQCESAIEVTTQNAISILNLSIQLESPQLKMKSLLFISKNLSKYFNNQDESQVLESSLVNFPTSAFEKLFELVKDKYGIYSVIPHNRRDKAVLLMEKERLVKVRVHEKMVEKLIGGSAKELTRQLIAYFVLLIVGIGYMHIQRIVAMKRMIPIINIFVLFLSILHLVKKIK